MAMYLLLVLLILCTDDLMRLIGKLSHVVVNQFLYKLSLEQMEKLAYGKLILVFDYFLLLLVLCRMLNEILLIMNLLL